jgi:hypothetical protein
MELPITGQCLCGNVRYAFAHEPKEMGLCYCKTCQRKSGSSHTAYLADAVSNITVTGSVTWYGATGESGLPKQHGFCQACGSVLFGKSDLWPGVLAVYAGSLDQSENFSPKVVIWACDAPSWALIDKSLPSIEKNP